MTENVKKVLDCVLGNGGRTILLCDLNIKARPLDQDQLDKSRWELLGGDLPSHGLAHIDLGIRLSRSSPLTNGETVSFIISISVIQISLGAVPHGKGHQAAVAGVL